MIWGYPKIVGRGDWRCDGVNRRVWRLTVGVGVLTYYRRRVESARLVCSRGVRARLRLVWRRLIERVTGGLPNDGYGVCENNQNTVDYTVVDAGVIDILWLEWFVANSIATYTLYNTSRSSVSCYGHTYGWCPGVRTCTRCRRWGKCTSGCGFYRSCDPRLSCDKLTSWMSGSPGCHPQNVGWIRRAQGWRTPALCRDGDSILPPSKHDPTTVLRRTVALFPGLFLESRRVRSATVDSWSSSSAFHTSAKTISHRKSSWSKSLSVCNVTRKIFTNRISISTQNNFNHGSFLHKNWNPHLESRSWPFWSTARKYLPRTTIISGQAMGTNHRPIRRTLPIPGRRIHIQRGNYRSTTTPSM